MKTSRSPFLCMVSAALFSACSTQETAAPREFRFFTPLTKAERKSAGTPAMGRNDEVLVQKDRVLDSLTRQIQVLREATAKLETMIVGENRVALEKGKKLTLQGVTFQRANAMLTKESEIVLRRAFVALVANPDVVVEIAAYTDELGNAMENEALSLRRAQAVKDWLVGSGIDAKRMTTVGLGMKEPLGPSTRDQGRAMNSRIEFHVKN